jgi:hypothetical protein
LTYFPDEHSFYNPRLKLRYRIADSIPVLLVAEAVAVNDDEDQRLQAKSVSDGNRATNRARRSG